MTPKKGMKLPLDERPPALSCCPLRINYMGLVDRGGIEPTTS
jgi:hypothetical protein